METSDTGKDSAKKTREAGDDVRVFDDRFEDDFGGNREGGDKPRTGALEVIVEHSVDRAMKVLKRKLIKEGLFKELKLRRYYEKPSEKKKRKSKEAAKKARKDEQKRSKNPFV